MKHYCPKCGSETDAGGTNENPSCSLCNSALIKSLGYRGVGLSPRFAMSRMATVVKKHGIQKALRSSRFKREREAWTAAVWALGQVEMTGREYWIEIETVEQTPDAKVFYLDQSAGHNKIMIRNLEIVDWEEHVEDVMEVIEQKCRKSYPGYFTLVVHARNEKTPDLGIVSQAISRLRVPSSEIWALRQASPTIFKVARLHPDLLLIEFDMNIQNAKVTSDIMVRKTRSRRTEFEDLGLGHVPIP